MIQICTTERTHHDGIKRIVIEEIDQPDTPENLWAAWQRALASTTSAQEASGSAAHSYFVVVPEKGVWRPVSGFAAYGQS